jgi:hypothetical protein
MTLLLGSEKKQTPIRWWKKSIDERGRFGVVDRLPQSMAAAF